MNISGPEVHFGSARRAYDHEGDHIKLIAFRARKAHHKVRSFEFGTLQSMTLLVQEWSPVHRPQTQNECPF